MKYIALVSKNWPEVADCVDVQENKHIYYQHYKNIGSFESPGKAWSAIYDFRKHHKKKISGS